MMIAKPGFLIGAAFLAALALAGGAFAQSSPVPQPPSDSNVRLNAPGLLPKKPPPGPPEIKAQPSVWPRLDAGAVLCRTEDDLDRLAARRRGDPVTGPIGCQIVHAATPVSIVQRKGPGKTQVTTTGPNAGGSGWTDVWLPDKAPVKAASASH